jgi:D-glycero-beta-D-manno-heptose-7-phosphate kinase
MPKEGKYRKLFDEFSKLRILIIGDVMVDSYLWGKVERISSEAPIPIVALRKKENRMGGAANVAMNVQSMGARPILCSVIGTDEKGGIFLDLMKKEKIETHAILRSSHRVTTTKFRIFGNSAQMLRLDEEVENDLTVADEEALLKIIDKILAETKIDCIIFQDYNKGVITPTLIKKVVDKAIQKNIHVSVDPKKKNFEAFKGVTLFKPNLKELKEGLKTDFSADDREKLMQAAGLLREKLGCQYILATLADKGVMLNMKDSIDEKNLFIPAHLRSISDVSGAGDTVISVASLCLASACSPYEIAFISNLAGGLVCEEVGVVPVNKDKLLKEVVSLL